MHISNIIEYLCISCPTPHPLSFYLLWYAIRHQRWCTLSTPSNTSTAVRLTHTARSFSELWSPESGRVWGLQVASLSKTMINTLDEPVLGLSAVGHGYSVKMLWLAPSIPRMCFDWLRYKNPVSQVETECRICSKWEILQSIHLDKRGDIVPSSPRDQLYLALHKHSVVVCNWEILQ